MNNPHQNARTTVHSRGLMVQRVMEGKEVSQVARDFGVSRRTVHKWLSRYREAGQTSLENRSSRPRRSPRRVRADKLHEIERLRGERKSSL